jgi:hypothetical protein
LRRGITLLSTGLIMEEILILVQSLSSDWGPSHYS